MKILSLNNSNRFKYNNQNANDKRIKNCKFSTFSTNVINFKKNINSEILYRTTISRSEELLQLINSAPLNKKLFKKISNIIPEQTSNFLPIAALLTPFNNFDLDSDIVDKYLELHKYNSQIYANKSPNEIAEYAINCFNIDIRKGEATFLPEIMNFIKENFEDNNLNKILTLCKNEEKTKIEARKLILFQKLTKIDIPFQYIEKSLKSEYSTHENYENYFKEAIDLTFCYDDAINTTEIALEKNLPIDYFKEIYKKAKENKEILKIYGEKIEDDDIKKLLFNKSRHLINTLEFLGEKTFLYSFIDKYKKVEEYIKNFGDIKYYTHYEDVIELINPQNSLRYKNANANISKLKKNFNNKTSEEQARTIQEINKNNAIIKNILKKSIKDPQEALTAAIIYKTIWQHDIESVNKIIPYLNPQTEADKEQFKKILNSIILEKMEVKLDIPKSSVIDFTKSKYLPTLFNTEKEFNYGLKLIFKILGDNPDKSITDVFNLLPQNITTRKLFERYKIDYDKWVNYNPNSFIIKSLHSDVDGTRTKTIKKLQDEINSCIWAYIPLYVINELNETLIKNGYMLKETYISTNQEKNIYKNNGKPIEYTDLKPIINTIISEFINKDFWKKTQLDADIDNAKQEIKRRFLGDINNEIKKLDYIKHTKNQTLELKFQKADMNAIEKSLFLGNDAGGCCSGVSKTREWTAPYYIINKMISCIEVKDNNDNGIGNTMCYIAKVDNVPSLILDNIELKSEYTYNEKIKEGLFEYAKILCKEIGHPEIPIYVSGKNNKVHLDKYPHKLKEMQILGSTGDTEVYLDFDTSGHKINPEEKFKNYLYKIR